MRHKIQRRNERHFFAANIVKKYELNKNIKIKFSFLNDFKSHLCLILLLLPELI